MRSPRRLGVLGGTFDPIHYGHLDAAEAARAAMELDEVVFVPTHDPPHKPADPRATAFQRFALVALAIQDAPGYRASDMELTREGASYTVDTLRALHADGWLPSQIFFIVGADAFADIATWRAFPGVLDLAHFVAVARPGTTLDAAAARTPELRHRMRIPGSGLRPLQADTAIYLVEARTRDVSSTTIRTRLAAGADIDDLVPPAVARHILAHQLYGAVDHLHGQDQGSSTETRA
jgi:nicotinate-nucleotide adenylyltransferase